MIGNEKEELEMVKLHVVNLMLKYNNIFPIARIIKNYTETFITPEEDNIDFYIFQNLMTKIGLDEIVKDRLSVLDKIWWETEQTSLKQLKASCIKSILACYFQKTPSNEEVITFKNITQEELDWC